MTGHRLISLGLASLCATAGGLAFASAPALAVSPPTIGEQSALNVASGSMTLQAEVNPQGSATTYRFEYDTSPYGSQATHGETLPSPEVSVGEGFTPVTVEVHAQGLSPATVYYYRVVATNLAREVVYGEEHTFITQHIGSGPILPDGRAWELVSPATKTGVTISSIGAGGGDVQASALGNAMTYNASGPVGDGVAGNTGLTQVLSERDAPGDWSSQDIATPNDSFGGGGVGGGGEYRLFSPDLSTALVEPSGNTLMSPDASEQTPYLRTQSTGEFSPLVTQANTLPGTKFGMPYPNNVTFRGATTDMSRIVLMSPAPLTEKAEERKNLYEWHNGQLSFINWLPGNALQGPFARLGYKDFNVRNAISTTGDVFWSEEEAEPHLYMRDIGNQETLEIDAAQEGLPEPVGGARFQIANKSGSRVFFTDSRQLTRDFTGHSGAPDLYVCEILEEAGKPACRLHDLTVAPVEGESADVQGVVLGSSEGGTDVYFVATGKLTTAKNAMGEEATSGQNNLYVDSYNSSNGEWQRPVFIASLSSEDGPDWAEGGGADLPYMTSRVSPNGRYLAFMSDRSLTNYDNRDAVSDMSDEEVFLYDAETNRLICASCNPTGARPAGVEDSVEDNGGTGLLVDDVGIWSSSHQWLAGNIPGWTPKELGTALYQSRYLSDSGRLFFESSDALVPRDTNGLEDVYEYEPTEIGSCTSTNTTFSEASGGCVALISSGASGEESEFLDTSETGDDVFFLTTGRLTTQDHDEALDVYDAHVCSQAEPCSASAVAAPACTTTDSCRAAPGPQPQIFGTPSSETFSGAGNLTAPTPAKPKPLTNVEKHAKALNACRAKHERRKRTTCEQQARRRYGLSHVKSHKGGK